jgi:hypothetical protein
MPCAREVGRLAGMFPSAKEPPVMDTTDIFTPLRELAHRTADGIDVTLLWDPVDDRAFVAVVDSRNGIVFEVEVGDANPMQVYNHPYAYCELELAA